LSSLFHVSSSSGSGTIAECPGLTLPLGSPTVVDRRVADESGATLTAVANAGAYVAVDASRCVATPRDPN